MATNKEKTIYLEHSNQKVKRITHSITSYTIGMEARLSTMKKVKVITTYGLQVSKEIWTERKNEVDKGYETHLK